MKKTCLSVFFGPDPAGPFQTCRKRPVFGVKTLVFGPKNGTLFSGHIVAYVKNHVNKFSFFGNKCVHFYKIPLFLLLL